MKEYESSKEVALRGGNYRENPYIDLEPNSGKYLVWHHEFIAYRTPDPECRKCHGSGFLAPLPESAGEFMGTQLECACNTKQNDKKTGL